jgi:hypothetical protein
MRGLWVSAGWSRQILLSTEMPMQASWLSSCLRRRRCQPPSNRTKIIREKRHSPGGEKGGHEVGEPLRVQNDL